MTHYEPTLGVDSGGGGLERRIDVRGKKLDWDRWWSASPSFSELLDCAREGLDVGSRPAELMVGAQELYAGEQRSSRPAHEALDASSRSTSRGARRPERAVTRRQAGGVGEGTGERAGPRGRRDGERDGLGIDAERGGCYGERDTEEMDTERTLDGNFKRIYLFLPIQSDLPNLLELICWSCFYWE